MAHNRTPRSRLLARLRHLRNWEAANLPLLPLLLLWIWRPIATVAWEIRGPALLLILTILAQGAFYWHIKAQSLQDDQPLPSWFSVTFSRVRGCILLAIALILGADIWLAMGRHGDWGDWAWGLGLLLFAILEYINYYHWQLMHDSAADWAFLRRHRRLRRASLAQDLVHARARQASMPVI